MSPAAPGPAAAVPVPFRSIPDCIRDHARLRGTHPALIDGESVATYAELDRWLDRIAAAFQRDGFAPGEVVAVCGESSAAYAAIFLGALRAGLVAAPLAPSSTGESLAAMVRDSGARALFCDRPSARMLAPLIAPETLPRITLDDSEPGVAMSAWLAPPGVAPQAVAIEADWPFNIIYSSGTTGSPKGIVQPHGMRWAHVQRSLAFGYGLDAVTQLATPLYSNTTLVSFFPTVALGGTVILTGKFDAAGWLAVAERRRTTHAMLVPVQYQRIMALPDFGRFDLASFRAKFCTSAPFPAALKADVLARWPGALIEFYGMTEGGGTCILQAQDFPAKLHTVGRPATGHDIRLIDEDGRELPPGAVGEVVGHSPAMMRGYHRQPEKTAEAEWHDLTGKRFIRTGDVGRFDEDGFLILMDRRKDMLISGGFNIYPSDLEAVLAQHPRVAEVAVVGVPCERWGETPVACVVPTPGDDAAASRLADDLLVWANLRLGKTQRLARVILVGELPRNAIGKVLKRELRERCLQDPR